MIKLCGESGETLWGWTETTEPRPYAPDLLAPAWWRWELRADLSDQTGQLSPLSARELALLGLPRHLRPLIEIVIDIISLYKNADDFFSTCDSADDASLFTA